jgi:hypothetical protein
MLNVITHRSTGKVFLRLCMRELPLRFIVTTSGQLFVYLSGVRLVGGLASCCVGPPTGTCGEGVCAVQITRISLVAAVAVPAVAIGLVNAVPASADCTYSSGVTLCSQGDVRGGSDQPSTNYGPYSPYPCELNYLCDDNYGVGIILDPGPPDRPDRPNRPNRPNRPGRPGR